MKNKEEDHLQIAEEKFSATTRGKFEKNMQELSERVKELECFYNISKILRKDERIDLILQDIANILPDAWQYPDITSARIKFEENVIVSKSFKDTKWKMSANIVVNKETKGSIEIYYNEERPELFEGPFLKEERNLLDGISEYISETVEGRIAQKQLDALNQQLMASNQQLTASEQQMRATNQQLAAGEQQLRAANQQLAASEQQLRATNQQLLASEKELISAKERAERNEKYYHTIINKIGDPLFVKDNQSRLLLVNDAFCNLFDLERTKIIGKTLAEDVAPEEREIFLRIDFEVLKTGKENLNEETLTVRGREQQTVLTRKSRFEDSKGNKFLIGIIRDITERKKFELELEAAKEKAEESDRLKSAFLANMSHEIRTPMNGILGFTDLLSKPEYTTEQKQKYFSIIKKSGHRLINTIDDIVDISRIESGESKIIISETNVNDQIEQVVSFFSPEARKKGLTIIKNCTLPDNKALITTDVDKLFATLSNLVKNAVKFTNEGVIKVGYQTRNDFLEFYIQDSGIGIKEEKQKSIFERFVQADTEITRSYEGSGLGLFICRSYVEMLGGKIWVDSKEGAGSTFCFTLPFERITQPGIESKQKSEISSSPVPKDLKILIVDDEELIRTYFYEGLNMDHKNLIEAKTGKDAVELCKKNNDIDVILMDIKMPGMDGYQAVREIRKFNKKVNIIAQTAYAMATDRDKALASGCNDYIVKPVNMEALKELLLNVR